MAKIELKKFNGGKEPTKEEINQYLKILHPTKT
jgi:hypothetical protein